MPKRKNKKLGKKKKVIVKKRRILDIKKKQEKNSDIIFDFTKGETDNLFALNPEEPKTETVFAELAEVCPRADLGQTLIIPKPPIPKRRGWKKIMSAFSIKNKFFSLFAGLVAAGIFCASVYVLAVPPDSKYDLGATLEPNCSPDATSPNYKANCSVVTPAAYSFGSNNFSGSGNFTTTGYIGIGTASPTYSLSLSGQAAQTIWMERETTAATAGNNLTLEAGGAKSGGF